MLQKSGRLVLWEAMFILELHSAETQEFNRFGMKFDSNDDLLHNKKKHSVMMQEPNSKRRARNHS